VKGVVKGKPLTPFNWCVQCGIVLTPIDIDLLEDDGFCLTKIQIGHWHQQHFVFAHTL
jgi:hypothetical protein